MIRLRAIVSRRFIPPDSVLDLVAGTLGQLGELEQIVGALAHIGAAQAEVAAVDQQVLADGELGVERVLLRHDAQSGTDARAVALAGPGRGPAACRRSIGETQPIIRIVEVLPAPFGPRKPNDSPGATSKSMASTAVKSPNVLVSPRAWMSEVESTDSGVSGMGGHGTARRDVPAAGRAGRPAEKHATQR